MNDYKTTTGIRIFEKNALQIYPQGPPAMEEAPYTFLNHPDLNISRQDQQRHAFQPISKVFHALYEKNLLLLPKPVELHSSFPG